MLNIQAYLLMLKRQKYGIGNNCSGCLFKEIGHLLLYQKFCFRRASVLSTVSTVFIGFVEPEIYQL